MPGIAASTKLTLELAGRPNSVELPENSLLSEVTCACTSMPMMISQSPVWPLMKLLGLGVRVSISANCYPSGNVVDRPMPRVEPLFQPYAHLRVPTRRAFGLERQDLGAVMLVEIHRPDVVGERIELDAVGPFELQQRLHAPEQRRAHPLVLEQRRHEQIWDVGAPPRPLAPAH